MRHPFLSCLPTAVEGIDALAELALDMRWSWNHAADEVWQQLDPTLWAITHNPWVILQTVSPERLTRLAADSSFRQKVDALCRARRQAAESPAWFQQAHGQVPLSAVAYFSMEFMLSEALPIYSGGLGNVAGDQLKAASDLGVPVVGVGLLYQQGYFRQIIDASGAQQALFPYNDPGQLPITPLRQPDGEWLRVEAKLSGYSVWLRTWQVQVGRVSLYLLDSNDPANLAVHRGITSELYGGGLELRLQQELVLGIGGWQMLRALGVQPEVCHLNEGHAAFAITVACQQERWRGTMETVEEDLRGVPDAELWHMRCAARQSLITYARERLAQQLAGAGASPAEVLREQHLFDPNALTLGFARRFATYKRPTLLLYDPDRLLRLLTDRQRPVQLIIAGKAHPADQAGQAMIHEWTRFIRRPEVWPHVVFLSDYDMLMTERPVQGVDVWINTPRRPWDASGTRGMKVLVNGGLNLSELDGWWAEAYTPEVGWALGDGQEHGDDPAWDAAEAEALYGLLEREVVPEFYGRDTQGVPTAWVARMRESMARLTPRFSAGRTVREYTERYYLPAATAYRQRAADTGALGARVLDWQRGLARHWTSVHFGDLHVETSEGQHVFQVQVYLDELAPDVVRVELYADGRDGDAPVRQEMVRGEPLMGAAHGYLYRARVPATRPAGDYTPRVVPYHPAAMVPLETAQILWQR